MDLTKGSIWQLLRKVTIPASTGSLFQTFYNLVDTYFAGKISPEALAAIAKSWPIYFIAIAVAVGIGAGTTALISNSIGAKEDRKASMYVAQSIVFAITISIFVTIFGLNFSNTPSSVNSVSLLEKSSLYLPPQLNVIPSLCSTESTLILYLLKIFQFSLEKSLPTIPINETSV